jgi:hypothetical protein
MSYPQHFDPQFNLLYCFVAPMPNDNESILSRISSFSGSEWAGYNNVMIWDIPKKKKFALFSPKELSEKESVNYILFETGYDLEKNERIFNDNSHILNNKPFTKRDPVNNMIIETYNRENKQNTLWFSDKWGLEKFKIATFSEIASWHLDVQNGDIRIIEPIDKDIKVLELRWYL